MALLLVALFVSVFVVGVRSDESLRAHANPDATYVLQILDDAPFPARATLTLPAPGQIAGDGPCNSYHATQTAPYPWFQAGPIVATRRACPELAQETAFFATLSEMTLSEALGDTLILSHIDGREMVFQSE